MWRSQAKSTATAVASTNQIRSTSSELGSSKPGGAANEPATLEMSPNASMKSSDPAISTWAPITTVTAQPLDRTSAQASAQSAAIMPSLATELATNGNSASANAPWSR